MKFLMVVIVVSSFCLTACSDSASTVRKATYPPDFKYLSTEVLGSNIHKLAFEMQMLDTLLTDEQINQHAVEETLRSIESIASSLQADNTRSNHPYLQNAYMGDFVTNVSVAHLEAAQSPPRYYQAGRISGACTNCHKINH